MIEYGHFIGGKRVAGTSGRKQDVTQPMDATVRGTVALSPLLSCAPPLEAPRPRRSAGLPPNCSAACAR